MSSIPHVKICHHNDSNIRSITGTHMVNYFTPRNMGNFTFVNTFVFASVTGSIV